MRLPILTALALGLGLVAAFGQAGTVPAPVPVPAPTPAQPATPQRQVEVPTSHADAARELVVTSGMNDQAQIHLTGIMRQLSQTIIQSNVAIQGDAPRRQALDETLRSVLEALAPAREQLVVSVALLYASRFTEQELKELTAFFRSPLGQKFQQAGGPIAQETSSVMGQWMQQVQQIAFDRVRAEMRRRGHPIN
jgi:hypothetical protein